MTDYNFCKCGHLHSVFNLLQKNCNCGCTNYEFLCTITPSDLCRNCGLNFPICHTAGSYNGVMHACIYNKINSFKHEKLYKILSSFPITNGYVTIGTTALSSTLKKCKENFVIMN